MIVGVDEVGRGSWAGPLCVAAVAWPDETYVTGLADSKQVARAKRGPLVHEIRRHAGDIGIGWVSARLIDQLGLTQALKLAARQAVNSIQASFDVVIIDGHLQLLDDPRAETMIKADSIVPAVMAASLIAKVARDTYMQALDLTLGRYQFSRHVGYGTALHRELLARFGPSQQHRMSYAPLKSLV